MFDLWPRQQSTLIVKWMTGDKMARSDRTHISTLSYSGKSQGKIKSGMAVTNKLKMIVIWVHRYAILTGHPFNYCNRGYMHLQEAPSGVSRVFVLPLSSTRCRQGKPRRAATKRYPYPPPPRAPTYLRDTILLKCIVGNLKEVLCEDITILWISKSCSCVSVRWCFIG